MPTITLYSKPNCPLCDQARYHLQQALAEPAGAGWVLDEINILDDQDLYREYRYRVPVIAVEDGAVLVAPLSLSPAMIRRALALRGDPALTDAANAALAEAAAERARMAQEESGVPVPPPGEPSAPALPAAWRPATGLPPAYQARPVPGWARLIGNFGNALVRNWLVALTTVLGIWVTLPWLAPVFARLGWWDAANAIYTTYIFFCHQLPERAGSLFGYQVAWCYRNTAIYTSMFFTAIAYLSWGRHGQGPRALRQGIGWQVLVICLLPALIDGLSHMLGLRAANAWFDTLTGGAFSAFSVGDTLGTLNWWLRVTTGALAGVAAVLFVFPWMNRTMTEEAAYWQRANRPPLGAPPAVAAIADAA